MSDVECAKLLLETVPRSMRSIRTEMRLFAKLDLTVPQFRILLRLFRQPCTNRELAEWLGVSAPTTSRMLSTLEKRKLIQRIQTAQDARQVTLSLTPKGLKRFMEIRGAAQSSFAKKISTLSELKKMALYGGLAVLGELFEDKG